MSYASLSGWSSIYIPTPMAKHIMAVNQTPPGFLTSFTTTRTFSFNLAFISLGVVTLISHTSTQNGLPDGHMFPLGFAQSYQCCVKCWKSIFDTDERR